MIYYKVKPEFDNFRRDKKGNIFIGNELYTKKELEQIYNSYKHCYFSVINFENIFEPVEIKKNKTYWFFGARFALED